MLELLASAPTGNVLPYIFLTLAALAEGTVIIFDGAAVSIGQLPLLPVFLAVVSGNLFADLGWYSLGRFGKLG
ncbi:MAG TPA: hypothetical protein DCK95_06870 [Anaerolineaceae bacterium]|nr:hypothetical protein [Anaerolineaceae bacterium]